ncbi:DUF3786 domain-containing protein [Chloroflexota bacterium]
MLIGEGHDWREGLDSAWDRLGTLIPDEVCRNTLADFDATAGHYVLPLFNEKIFISSEERTILGNSGVAEIALNDLPHYSFLSSLWYLIRARDVCPSGTLVNPGEVSGGLIFNMGDHQLPLDMIINKYGQDTEKLIQKGIELGGESLDFADAAVRLFPFPKVPVVVLVWGQDDEFPARADILFDSTCTDHMPTDILWSTAMMSILVM